MKKLLKVLIPAVILFVALWVSPNRGLAEVTYPLVPTTCGPAPQCPLTGSCTAGTFRVCCIVNVGFRGCTCSGGHFVCES
jgi:hypothetical protein